MSNSNTNAYTSDLATSELRKLFPEMSYESLCKMRAFQKVWECTNKEIPFNPEWNNGTGYLDHLVSGDIAVEVIDSEEECVDGVPSVIVCDYAKGITENGRRFIVCGTHLGPIVMFERHSLEREGEIYRICFNEPRKFHKVGYYVNTNMDASEIRRFGNCFGFTSYAEGISNVVKGVMKAL